MAVDASRVRHPRLMSVTRPTHRVDPIALFASATGARDRALWLRPSTGEALVGIGHACSFSADLGAAWRELLADADSDGPGGPMLLGGFAFDPSIPPGALWSGFDAGRLVLPERMLRIEPGGATWLTTNALTGPRQMRPQQTAPAATSRTGLQPASWRALVADIARGIRSNRIGVRKVVLARTRQVRLRVTLEFALRRLATEYAGCTIFAFAVGEACFVGATPECLVALQDGTATMMALAGSGPRGSTPAEDAHLARRLQEDEKERAEHAVVVQALREDLAPVCTRVVAEADPRIHALANVQHLVTPIRAQVKDECSLLDLVARLHPSPAVGGYPRQRALELIREREHLDRGWYAGPLGWVDAKGEGEFMVGLRSALVRDGTATLFAGCGIVGDSDPDREYAESGWKLRPMLAAFGAEDDRIG